MAVSLRMENLDTDIPLPEELDPSAIGEDDANSFLTTARNGIWEQSQLWHS